MVSEDGYSDVKKFLEDFDKQHDNKIKQKDPDEILFE